MPAPVGLPPNSRAIPIEHSINNLPPNTHVRPISAMPAPEISNTSEPQISVDNSEMNTKVTRGNAIEYSPAFRKKLADAVTQAKLHGDASESGFWVGASGGMTPTDTEQGREITIDPAPTAKLMVHTHPTNRGASEHPSDNDIKQAKRKGIPLITASDKGIYETGPDGKTVLVAEGADWENPTKHLKEEDQP